MARLGLGLGREPGLPTLRAVIVCQLTRPAQVSVAMPGRFIWHGTAALAPRFGPWNVRGGGAPSPLATIRLGQTRKPRPRRKTRGSFFCFRTLAGRMRGMWGTVASRFLDWAT